MNLIPLKFFVQKIYHIPLRPCSKIIYSIICVQKIFPCVQNAKFNVFLTHSVYNIYIYIYIRNHLIVYSELKNGSCQCPLMLRRLDQVRINLISVTISKYKTSDFSRFFFFQKKNSRAIVFIISQFNLVVCLFNLIFVCNLQRLFFNCIYHYSLSVICNYYRMKCFIYLALKFQAVQAAACLFFCS